MHDRPEASRLRKIRWRAKHRELARLAKIQARDAKRIAKGLLPLKLANAEKVRKFREKQKLLQERIRTAWYGPTLTDAEFEEYAKKEGWDSSQRESQWTALHRVAAICEVNVNAYLIRHYGQGAEDARLLFHEAFLQTQDIGKALELAKTIKIQFVGRNSIYVDLNRQERYQAAKEKWGDGSAIVESLTGRRKDKTDE